ncbi:uncharacterized protein LOC129790470 [Lutzomyia longipalpis]|uniref:uncharacterized protein LOC129790470 n=1 Tax=Lutzomyia longipalpis TaxID=7200 RepID=UPI0024840026|nr:uncharacterized protein LOC129790470 [Lutzomyia longipalpis]XP_055683948.1 uncharacterized protein LOC129790470 [Lutzomyia longipalpis]
MEIMAKNILNLLIIALVVAQCVELKPMDRFEDFDWDNFGESLANKIQSSITQSFQQSGIYELGPKIEKQVQQSMDNSMWYKRPNACSDEKVDVTDEKRPGCENGSNVSQSQMCNEINGVSVCTITETRGCQTKRTTRTYRCCENFTLKNIDGKMQCA